MAYYLDEFNPALPSKVSYCKRISVADYELQGAEETQSELEKLLEYLDKYPETYYDTLRKRKRDELNVISWIKVKVMTAFHGEQYLDYYFPEEECQTQLKCLKNDMVSAYDYSQEATGSGKRFSKRLAEKRKQEEMKKAEETTKIPVPPPPPPVTLMKHSKDKNTEDIENRKPIKKKFNSVVNKDAQDSGSAQAVSSDLKTINNELFKSMRSVSGRGQKTESENPAASEATKIQNTEKQTNNLKTMKKSLSQKLSQSSPQKNLNDEISDARKKLKCLDSQNNLKTTKKSLPQKLSKSSLQKNLNDEITNARKKLKCLNQNSPDGPTSPYQICKQQREANKRTPDQHSLPFNVALLQKFRNARSPRSPASPIGCFDDTLT